MFDEIIETSVKPDGEIEVARQPQPGGSGERRQGLCQFRKGVPAPPLAPGRCYRLRATRYPVVACS